MSSTAVVEDRSCVVESGGGRILVLWIGGGVAGGRVGLEVRSISGSGWDSVIGTSDALAGSGIGSSDVVIIRARVERVLIMMSLAFLFVEDLEFKANELSSLEPP